MTIICRDGCGASAPDLKTAEHEGWSSLQATGGMRCGNCSGELWRANKIVGAPNDPNNHDPLLPPNGESRGALPKETAHTILPPSKIN